MTQDLTTKVKTHVIITYTKSHHFITAGQQAALVNLSGDQFIEIDGNKIRGSSIAEIMTMEKYRETYPEKAPYNYGQPPTPLPPDARILYKSVEQKMSERKSWLEAGLRGLKKAQAKFRAEGRPSPNCDEMIRRLEKKIQDFKESPSLT